VTFEEFHERICAALRGNRAPVVMETQRRMKFKLYRVASLTRDVREQRLKRGLARGCRGPYLDAQPLAMDSAIAH
jgi:phage portal protein BeeE